MNGLKSKVAVAAMAGLMVTLPVDEGGVSEKGAKPYYDIVGVKTVCYGHTGKDIEDRWYTKQECLALLEKDASRHMNRVLSGMKREPTTGQLKAFTGMDFNTGGWVGSRSNREFNLGNDKESCVALAWGPPDAQGKRQPAWAYAKGKFINGLHLRRKRDVNDCLAGLV